MFSIPLFVRVSLVFGSVLCSACAGTAPPYQATQAPLVFYTVTGELALSRHEPRVAALQYAAAVETDSDVGLLRRATEVAAQGLQPSLAADAAARWVHVDPASVDANRAAAAAALDLHQIESAASHYRVVLQNSAAGSDSEFARLEAQFGSSDNAYGAHQLADRLALSYPTSLPALRVQAFAALRADDPAAAARAFSAALALPAAQEGEAQRDLTRAWWRARILAGDAAEPLAEAQALVAQDDSVENRLEYALLLLAAQRNDRATAELDALAKSPDAAPAAIRLLGLLAFQQGRLDQARVLFTQLLATGKFLDDALYYLGLIAERHDDADRALRLFSQVQRGDNAVPALIRAAGLLSTHGKGAAADQLFDQMLIDVPQRAPGILAARARLYADAGDLKRAIDVLDQAELEYPDSMELRYARASTYEEQGRVSEALRELKAVSKLRPDDPAALNALGYTLADHDKKLTEARGMIERAYRVAPKSPAILDSLGWVLYRQGHSEEALPYLSAAFADDRSGEIAAHLGEVLWQLGQRSEAQRIWVEATKVDADNPTLQATRRRLHAPN